MKVSCWPLNWNSGKIRFVPPPSIGDETFGLPPLIYFWMNEKGWDGSTVHARREAVGAAASPLLSGGGGVRTLLQSAGEQYWTLPLLKWTWSLNWILPLLKWTYTSHQSTLPAMPGAFWRWWILSSCSQNYRNARYPEQSGRGDPLQPSARDAHLKGRPDFQKCCGHYPECSRGAVCPHHGLVPLNEPRSLSLALSVWWLQMNWQDILNQSTPCIQ